MGWDRGVRHQCSAGHAGQGSQVHFKVEVVHPNQCNTALQVWKVKMSEQPVYIQNMCQPTNKRSSSQRTLLLPVVEKPTSTNSFIVRSATTWNHLPPSNREAQQLAPFKVMFKKWVRENISIE